MAVFIRENALITFLIFLVVLIAGNVLLFMQSKNPQKNLKDWFILKKTSESFGDPWKKETDQLNELSERVAALKKSPPADIESNPN
jgi:hypothetical protein